MKKMLSDIFGLNKTFNQINIKKEVIEKICDLSRDSHPKEFLCFFEGYIGKNVVITDLIFQPYIADERSALPRLDIPLTTNIIGSVHSHPGPSNRPSRADRQFFKKTGIVHAIINKPYTPNDIQFYDIDGEPIEIMIV